MTDVINILVCDDDPQFAAACVTELRERLTTRQRFPLDTFNLHPCSNLRQIKNIVTDTAAARRWHLIFCDLGWGDLTLEGIQILHDMQMRNPEIGTVLYTAQDTASIVGQTLEWKLHFIDHVLHVTQADFYQRAIAIILAFLQGRESEPGSDVQFAGTQLVPEAQRGTWLETLAREVRTLQQAFAELTAQSGNPDVAAEILLTPEEAQVKFVVGPETQKRKLYTELIASLRKFPDVEPHDLIPLAKSKYLAFIQEEYEDFPKMAAARGLDLNHIYRVNRRFKHAPFIVFKMETVEEIVAGPDRSERLATIQKLLCPESTIKKAAQK